MLPSAHRQVRSEEVNSIRKISLDEPRRIRWVKRIYFRNRDLPGRFGAPNTHPISRVLFYLIVVEGMTESIDLNSIIVCCSITKVTVLGTSGQRVSRG